MLAIALTVLIVLSTSVGATTLQRFNLSELADHAERIVVATCQQSEPALIDGQIYHFFLKDILDCEIYTRYSFAVSETVKGRTESTFTLHLPGGQFQGVQSRIVGMPSFAAGKEFVLFLTEKNALGHAWPVGLGQGKFNIKRTAKKEARVHQDLDGLSFYQTAAKRAAPVAPVQNVELGNFLKRIRALDTSSPTGQNDAH